MSDQMPILGLPQIQLSPEELAAAIDMDVIEDIRAEMRLLPEGRQVDKMKRVVGYVMRQHFEDESCGMSKSQFLASLVYLYAIGYLVPVTAVQRPAWTQPAARPAAPADIAAYFGNEDTDDGAAEADDEFDFH